MAADRPAEEASLREVSPPAPEQGGRGSSPSPAGGGPEGSQSTPDAAHTQAEQASGTSQGHVSPDTGGSGGHLGSAPAASEHPLEDFKPSGTELVVADPRESTDVLRVLDAHDEAQILDELQQRLSKTMLYDFEMDGGKVVDLSYRGISEAIRLMTQRGASIRIVPEATSIESVVEDLGNGPEPCWQATVYAEERNTGYGQHGTFIQPKRKKLRAETAKRLKQRGKSVTDDGMIASPHARQIALNKAQRNALRTMIPESVREVLIAQYRGDSDRVAKIRMGAGAAAVAELPPPVTGDEADELVKRCEAAYRRVTEVSRTDYMIPGRFWTELSRARSSLPTLKVFAEMVEGLAEKAEADNKEGSDGRND